MPEERDNSFAFIDLFAGIGGMRRGFESIGGHCVFTSEWDKYAVKTYRANFGCEHRIETGDIASVDPLHIPEHDVLLAGFPCQPFSLAGVSKKQALGRAHGFRCKTQGTLFFNVAEIIESHRPAAFLLENVKNLVSHDKGRTFSIILETLRDELGYEVHYRVIDARSFVPQHRERVFLVGFRKESGVREAFNFETLPLPPAAGNPTLASILHNSSEPLDAPYTERCRGQLRVNPKYTLTPKLWQYLQEYKEKHRRKGNGFGYGLCTATDVARTLSARYHKDGAEILIKQHRKPPRRLTPRECARLMGFEQQGRAEFIIPVSDTQAYRQFGNSVVVPVIETIARHMQPHIHSRVVAGRKPRAPQKTVQYSA